MAVNPALLELAKTRVWNDLAAQMEKAAVVPPGGGAPPAGGAPPMDPAMMGGAPPMDPSMMGAPPPMDPAMMGGAPPMDPAMMGGAPPMDPAAAAGGAAPAAPVKLKPEDMMKQLDYRLYNIQQQLTAIMNHGKISIPPGALITPPGSPTPVAEAALPGGPQDPTTMGGGSADGGAGGGSAISPIAAIQGAAPELATGGGGSEPKMAAAIGAPFQLTQRHAGSVNASAVASLLASLGGR